MARAGRGEPDVIVNFSDGCSYSKTKLEDIFRNGLLDRPPVKSVKDAASAKKEDVDLIVDEFECSRTQAEKVLAQNGGEIEKALKALLTPSWTT